jgi:hypothetical protein
LSDRIAEVLAGEPSPAEVKVLIAEAEDELKRLHHKREKAHRLSLDPLARADAVTKAREDTKASDFAVERLGVALTHLRTKHEAAVERVEEVERAAFRAEVTAERDALVVDELRTRYPEWAGALVDLFTRITANNERAKQAGIGGMQSGENLARGTTPVDIHRLIDAVRLPPLDYQAQAMGQMLWPKPIEHKILLPRHLEEYAAREGDKARRIGKEVAAKRKAEAKSAIRRVG